MSVGLSHFAFPFDGSTVEQGSDQEIAACMAVVLSWPLGTREGNPDFGVDEQAFLNDGASLDEIRQALDVNEPRALTEITADDTQLGQFLEQVRVGYAPAQQQPQQ